MKGPWWGLGNYEITSSTRNRSATTPCVLDQPQPSKKGKTMTLVERLVDARTRGMGKGWRAKQLGVFNSPILRLQGILIMTVSSWLTTNFLTDGLPVQDEYSKGQDRKKDGKFVGSGAKTKKAISLSYLNYA
ncbi:hypothetical protein IV203_029685 [Nitzschia inconspicua]|uniref:Uncharacterized protein n=1 Tax=Nitzschia inconspicua TaxID=303405 RepID=A0A9K3Q1G5_9STRA|nr:hypothetical protein IV203_029685 [Nitzschia inconspicua]